MGGGPWRKLSIGWKLRENALNASNIHTISYSMIEAGLEMAMSINVFVVIAITEWAALGKGDAIGS